jgi:hypothetical protein
MSPEESPQKFVLGQYNLLVTELQDTYQELSDYY